MAGPPLRRPHVLWVTENHPPSPGGMAVSSDRIVRGLRALDIEVDVVHLCRRPSPGPWEIQQHGRYLAFPIGEDAAHDLSVLFELLARDAHRPSLTHVLAFGGNLPVVAAPNYAAWLNLPLITLFRGNDFDSAVFSPQRRAVLREAIERSARICVVSRDKRERILALFPQARVDWTPNSIDLDDWTVLPSDAEAAQVWRLENVPSGKRVLGLFGQIKAKKGGLQIVNALLAAGLGAKVHLLLVGEVHEAVRERLAAESASLGSTLIPFVDRYALIRYYLACDAVAIPSYYDGMPNTLLEAMGLGLPLLASDAGGMKDVLRDGVHGFVFPAADDDGCRRALRLFVEAAPETLQAMGIACRKTAAEFDLAGEAGRYEDILLETLRQPEHHSLELVDKDS
jgi:glycogen(starch) synthase